MLEVRNDARASHLFKEHRQTVFRERMRLKEMG
jgi:hypothetical protein